MSRDLVYQFHILPRPSSAWVIAFLMQCNGPSACICLQSKKKTDGFVDAELDQSETMAHEIESFSEGRCGADGPERCL